VHTYFGGSDQNVFRAYKHEVNELIGKSNTEINDKLEPIVKGLGLKTARQNFTYNAAGNTYSGENLYAILQAPRGDATEAIVLVAAWENVKHEINRNGIPLALTLLRYFKRWSLWSKDIILVLTPDSIAGPQAWVDAYHDAHDPSRVSSLPIKSGLLQGAIALDYAQESRFESVHVVYDGVNGQLPNLDLINSIVHIAQGQMGINVALQEMWHHNNGYPDRLRTMLRGMLKQGLGLASGAHSSFIPYHVDAVTLRPFGEGWQDEMAMGRVIEGTFRSLNNLLEHLHQSFFFYLLMQRERFVSIGTYLPSAMLVAANFTIMAIALWVKSGQPAEASTPATKTDTTATAPPTAERDLFLPLGVVTLIQSLSIIPLYLFNHAPESVSRPSPPPPPPSPFDSLLPILTRHSPGPHPPLPPLHLSQRPAPPDPLPPPDHPPQPHPATIPPHQVLLPFIAGHVPLLPRNTQLLPRAHHGLACFAAVVCPQPLFDNYNTGTGISISG
jgi:glycosylphosphatidylinositol transamidase